MFRFRRILQLMLLSALGCGSGERTPEASSAGMAGASGGGEQTPGAGSAGMAGTGGASGGAPMQSLGGVNGHGGKDANGLACGGDVKGAWFARQEPASPGRPNDVNECFNLALQRTPSGLYGQVWLDYLATPRTVYLNFAASVAPMTEGAYVSAQYYEGNVVQDFSEECLVDNMQLKATCPELSDTLNNLGLGEGWWSDVVCTAGASESCSCSFRIHRASGHAGMWSPDPEETTQLLLSRRSAVNSEVFESFEVPYCVSEQGLSFGAAVDEVLPNTSLLRFEQVNCSDGFQGPGETGPDCGGACLDPCR